MERNNISTNVDLSFVNTILQINNEELSTKVFYKNELVSMWWLWSSWDCHFLFIKEC